jgi:uncharacterized protein DUF397
MLTPDVTGARWRKSTRSNGSGACVEVGVTDSAAGVRDTKLGEASPVLVFPRAQWASFVGSLRNGNLDSLD